MTPSAVFFIVAMRHGISFQSCLYLTCLSLHLWHHLLIGIKRPACPLDGRVPRSQEDVALLYVARSHTKSGEDIWKMLLVRIVGNSEASSRVLPWSLGFVQPIDGRCILDW
jgi:hypothetical protein